MSKSTFRTVSGSLPEDVVVFNQEEAVDLDKQIYFGSLRVRRVGQNNITPGDFWNAVMDRGINNFQDSDPWAEPYLEEDPETIGILTKAVAQEAVRQGKTSWHYAGNTVYWEQEYAEDRVEESLLEHYNSLPVLEIEGTEEEKPLTEEDLRISPRSETYVDLPEGELLVMLGLSVNGWSQPKQSI